MTGAIETVTKSAYSLGDLVTTPRGLVAQVVGSDGERLRLTYLPVGEVELLPELLRPIAGSAAMLNGEPA